MKVKSLKQLVESEIKRFLKEESAIQGQDNLVPVIKDLGIDPAHFQIAYSLVKQNKKLNSAANKILADVMIALIKSDNDDLITRFATQLKALEATSTEEP